MPAKNNENCIVTSPYVVMWFWFFKRLGRHELETFCQPLSANKMQYTNENNLNPLSQVLEKG